MSGLDKYTCYKQYIWRITEASYQPDAGHNAIESVCLDGSAAAPGTRCATTRCTGGYNMIAAQTIVLPPVGILYVVLTKQ